MYSYTSATLAIRAKCSLSYYHISPPNDQSYCCYRPCCHFPANGVFPVIPRVISGYLLGQTIAVPSSTLVSCRRRFARVFPRSRCSEMMELLSEPEGGFHGSEGKGWKGGRKEIEIKSVERERQRCDGSSSVVSTSSTLLRDLELNGTGRRRVGGVSIVGYGNSKKGTKFDADVAEEEAREVHKYVDDSWQGKRHSSKRDVVVNSTKDDSMKENDCLRQLGVKDGHENAGQQENHRGNELHKRSQKITRISEVQSDVKRTSVSANVRGTEKRESSVSGAREYSDTYQVVRHDEPRRNHEKQFKVADFHDTNVQNATYTHRGFQGTTIREREEQTNLEKNSAHLAHDKRIHFNRNTIEQDESARRTQRLREVSGSPSSDFEKASGADDKSLLGMEVRANLVRDSGQVVRKKMTQIALQRPVESKSNKRDEKLAKEGNSLQLKIGEGKQIDNRVLELDEARRNTEMLSQVSKVHSCNLEALSLFEGRRITEMEFNSNFIQSSVPSTKDKGIQVEVHEANHDQIEMSRFNANNILNSTNLWSPPDSRVDPREYNTHLDLNQVSSLREQYSQANEEGYLQYSAGVESERDTNEFDLTRRNTRRIYSSQENYNSRIENKNETSLARTSVLLTQEEKEMQRSSLTGYSSKSASMQITSTGCFHDISSSQPTYIELNDNAGHVPQITNDSAAKSDKSSASHVTEFVGKRQKEIVEVNESGKIPNFTSGIQIEEPGRRGIQETLRIGNKKETFATVLTEDRKERGSSFLGESSQSKYMRMDSASSDGILNSLKTHIGVDYNSDRDAIDQITNDAIESAKQFDKYSAFHAGEFADKIQQELMSLKKSGTEPNVSSGVQTEGTVRRESQATASMQVGGLNESRSYGDGRCTTEGGRLLSSELGLRGPSDEMWDVQGPSTQETLNDKGPEVDFATSEAVVLTNPTRRETAAIIRRPPKSLWSYVTDIIRMSWVLRGHSHSSTLASNRRASSNDSLSSDTWFSGNEPDEVAARDETQNEEKISLLKESVPVEESVEILFEEQKNGYRLAVSEPSSSISSGLMNKGLSSQASSSSIEAMHKEGAKSSHGTLSSVDIVEQRLALETNATLPCTTDMVESSARDNVKVLKPSSSFPVAMIKKGFSSSITQAADKLESAQVWESGKSGLEILEQPSGSIIDSVLPRITEVEEVDMSGSSIPKSELVPSREKLPEIGGIMESDIKRRKFQRNNQVIKEQFDEWEEAFTLENEQRRFDENFMKEAILEAWKGADTWEVPVGAVLVHNGKIIARGCNMVEELRDSTAHAEMICIREASKLLRTWRLAETTLYVTLEPCPMCAGAILQSRIDTVVWGAPNKLLGADGSWVRLFPGGGDGGTSNMDPPTQMAGPVHPFHPKINVRRGVLANECSDVMQQFFKLRRKKNKRPESSPPSHLSISNRPAKFFTKLHNIFCIMFCL